MFTVICTKSDNPKDAIPAICIDETGKEPALYFQVDKAIRLAVELQKSFPNAEYKIMQLINA